ncbi:hypothetical protein C8J57DRAFT_1717432 [Mycena rebaudengoi]|nr:hypothetical protein C8J57DRAFT_1717432 [Mycena rebaudengoi]
MRIPAARAPPRARRRTPRPPSPPRAFALRRRTSVFTPRASLPAPSIVRSAAGSIGGRCGVPAAPPAPSHTTTPAHPHLTSSCAYPPPAHRAKVEPAPTRPSCPTHPPSNVTSPSPSFERHVPPALPRTSYPTSI